MATDTKGLSPEFEGKVLRVFFKDGEIAELKLLHFDVHEDCEFGDDHAGIIYDVLGTNHPDDYEDLKAGACWSDFAEIEKFELVN